jgi:hypothetical protein
MPSSKGSADYGGTDSGDTAFIIICGSLVLLMALPGIVLFYGRWPLPRPFLARVHAGAAAPFAVMWPLRAGGASRARTQTGSRHSAHMRRKCKFADPRPAI